MPASAPLAATPPDVHPTRATVDLEAAIRHLSADGLVAFPTETVWGLAARARSEVAVTAMRRWKGRDADQPVSVLVADAGAIASVGVVATEPARRLMAAYWPGPLTLVMSAEARLARRVARVDGAVGLRCSGHPVAAALVAAADQAGLGPLTATSLNRSGEPPTRTLGEALALCAGARAGDDAPLVLEPSAHDAEGEVPSTVLDLSSDPARILRSGVIEADALRECAGVRVESARGAADSRTDPSQGEETE